MARFFNEVCYKLSGMSFKPRGLIIIMRVLKNDFHLTWHDSAQSILLWHFPETYSVPELLESAEQVKAWVESSSTQRIDLIMLMEKCPLEERGGVLLPFAGLFWQVSVRAERIICVSHTMLTEVTLRVLRGTNPHRREKVAVVPHLDEAFEIISEERGVYVS